MSRLSESPTIPLSPKRNLHLAHPTEELHHGPLRVACRFGHIQVCAHGDGVVFDVQAHGYDTEGYEYRRHAYLALDLKELRDLRDVLSSALVMRMPISVAA